MDSNFRISSGAVSDRGLSEKRPQNEDSYLDMGRCGVYAVADGVGGAQAGEVASQMAIEILAEAFANRKDGDDAESVMRAAIERANSAIHQMAHELSQLSNMATTIVALHLDENIATIGHVGDSRLYRVDREGFLYPETADHSVVAAEVRAGRMTQDQADNHPSRNIINRALGADSAVEVDLKTIMIDPGTAFLICSDGITRHVSDEEIKGVLTFGGDPSEICEYLKGLCYERGAEDNLTAVVIKASAAENAQHEAAAPILLEIEEPTAASARPTFGNQSPEDDDDDELLELETDDFTVRKQTPEIPYDPENSADEFPHSDPAGLPPPISSKQDIFEPERREPFNDEAFSIFGNSDSAPDEFKKPGLAGRAAPTIATLALGAILGIGLFYFAFFPGPPADVASPQLSVMRTDNIPLSAFEENRRNVDKDPAGYVAKFGSDPQDSEDFYLLGRAYLLSADYPKARLALTEAQNKLSEADPVNVKVLASDIAMALAVTNDTTIQSMLRKALEPPVPANVNR